MKSWRKVKEKNSDNLTRCILCLEYENKTDFTAKLLNDDKVYTSDKILFQNLIDKNTQLKDTKIIEEAIFLSDDVELPKISFEIRSMDDKEAEIEIVFEATPGVHLVLFKIICFKSFHQSSYDCWWDLIAHSIDLETLQYRNEIDILKDRIILLEESLVEKEDNFNKNTEELVIKSVELLNKKKAKIQRTEPINKNETDESNDNADGTSVNAAVEDLVPSNVALQNTPPFSLEEPIFQPVIIKKRKLNVTQKEKDEASRNTAQEEGIVESTLDDLE
ncbi:hypothetical protein ROZALSC1DRAFT_30469 [Rozella allomycis CSF55]|uniref:Uncharacterized protein n=1 Tax=Rozella allomycis (strain CSF55) TaxID=988480 RepID=A0A075AX39_ROZAC|nr:hypothetical protein O9G_002425 [Rozella allomycis CSF55]RKP17761.1 hypothetical protein ROZALSC1DRAFT_30469 [Rozella allomycis CSF55]|eukprot:EPZ34827.1 hypothetical protein O9G_002425 [Rozella allomycis CSF55]